MINIKKLLAVGIILLFTSTVFTPGITANNPILTKTIYVDDDNTAGPWDGTQEHPYQYIQDGIDAASEGDTIFVYCGIYYENVIIDKTINLIGENRNTTIIDGSGIGDVVYISADWMSIFGFTIQNGFSGIELYYSSNNNIISGNNIINNYYGINLQSFSSYNTINSNNIITDCGDGIMLWDSSNNNNISGNNIITDCGDGIYIGYSSNNKISHNIIKGGITIAHSSTTITDNTLYSYGITIYGFGICDYGNHLDYWNTHIIENNRVNGKPIRYYKNLDNVVVPSDTGQVILANCTNFIIQNLSIINIQLGYSSNNTINDNNISNNNYDGIYLSNSSNNTISGNSINNNYWSGIYLIYSSTNNNINGNNICNNMDGISLIFDSSNNTINDNNISNNNYDGIDLSSNNNIISTNNISNNYDGIELCSSNNNISGNKIGNNDDCGIYLWHSSKNIISCNNISNNNHTGVYLMRSSNNNNTISRNNIKDNNEYGVYIHNSLNNLITSNNFIGNTVNAYDTGNNIWNKLGKGNYWDDYEERYPDAHKKWLKGIWDTPYDIPGRDNQDRYPLIKPYSKSESIPCINSLFLRFLENHPYIFPILRHLLKL